MIIQRGGVKKDDSDREEDEKKTELPKRSTSPCYPHRELG